VVLSETAVRVWLDEELPLHDAAMGGQLLELARVVLKNAGRHLLKFQRQWAVAGEKVAGCIRESFPLTHPAPAPASEPAPAPLADDTPPAAAAPQDDAGEPASNAEDAEDCAEEAEKDI
jgi:hypothetical protein